VWLSGWLCAGLGKWKLSCWGCQEVKCGGTSLDFPKKIHESYRFFDFFRLRRLHLTCSVKEGSWRFFGGSIDTMHGGKYRPFFSQKSVTFEPVVRF
jgi:hypothetical protein